MTAPLNAPDLGQVTPEIRNERFGFEFDDSWFDVEVMGQMRHWDGIPIVEDTSGALTREMPFVMVSDGMRQYLMAEARELHLWRVRVEAGLEARRIIREGMADVLDWLHAAGHDV